MSRWSVSSLLHLVLAALALPMCHPLPSVGPPESPPRPSEVNREPNVKVDSLESRRPPPVLHLEGEFPGLKLGYGVNSVTEAVGGLCVKPPPAGAGCSGPKHASLNAKFISDTASMKSELGISAAASFSSGVWGADASARFSKSTSMRSDSAYLYVEAVVQYAPYTFDATLTPASLELLAHDPAGFVLRCGDSYAASVTAGARFRAIYEFKHVSGDSRRSLDAQFSAFGPGVTATGALDEAVASASERYDVSLYVSQTGGDFAYQEPGIAVEWTPGNLRKKAESFADKVTCENAMPLVVTTKDYYGAGIPANMRIPDLVKARDKIAELAPNLDRARIASNDIAERLANPGRLSEENCTDDKAMLERRKRELDTYAKFVDDQGKACLSVSSNGADKNCLTDAASVPSFELPQLIHPKECGPRCTNGDGSLPADSDRYGYCQRCTWKGDGKDLPNQAGGFMSRTCRFMRRGSTVLVRARGYVQTLISEPGEKAGLHFFLESSSAGKTTSCDPAWDCTLSQMVSAPGGGTVPFSFRIPEVRVEKKAENASVEAHLFQTFCNKFNVNDPARQGCRYVGIEFDICDVSSTGGCDWPLPQ